MRHIFSTNENVEKAGTTQLPCSIVGVRIKAVRFSLTDNSGRRVSLAQINFRHLLYLDSSGLS